MVLLQQQVPGVPFSAWLVAIIFLAVLAGIAYWLVQMVRQGKGGARQAAGMRVIGRLPLSMNQSVVLVAVGSEVLLLGVGQRVELLWRIEDAEMKESVLREMSLPSGGVPLAGTLRGLQDSDFRGLLEDSLRRVREGRNLRRERGERDE